MLTILIPALIGYIIGATSLATLALVATRRTPRRSPSPPYRPKHPRSSIGRD